MRIIIIGGGIVGYSLAEHLLKDNHELSLIEMDTSLSDSLSGKLDVRLISGSGSSPDNLRQAGIDGADMVLAVTPNDEVNLVVCALAAQYKVPQRIARLRSPEFTREDALVDLNGLGVTSVIHPEKVMADQIMQYIGSPHAVESANFENGRVLLRGYRLRENMELCGKTPLEIRQQIAPTMVLFAAINRKGQGMIPTGNTRFEAGDVVYSIFPRDSLDTFLKLVGIERKKHRKIIATGDTYASIQLAKRLDETDHHVTFVSPEIKQAEEIAGRFDNIEVLHGDCTDNDFLRDINVSAASFFVSLSGNDDYNVMSTLLAKAEGAHEVIASSVETSHYRLFTSIGIDHVINTRLTAARAILDIIARGHIGAVVELSHIDIEAARFIVEPESEIAGLKVKNIAKKFKAGAIIGILVRDNTIQLPDGETVIEAEDHIIVITRHKHLSSLTRLFKPRKLFG